MKKHTHWNHIRNLGNILAPFIIYFFVYILSAVCLSALLTGLLQGMGDSMRNFILEREATVNGIMNGLAMLFGAMPLVPAFRQEIRIQPATGKTAKGRATDEKRTDKQRVSGLFILITITLAFTSSLAVNGLFVHFHFLESSETYKQVADSQYGVLFPVGLLLYGIVAPLTEELVFRGLLYNRMKKHFSVLPAILLSAMIFGIYHGNSVQGLYGFLIGILIACTYEKFGSLLYPMLFHAVANVTVYSITGDQRLYEIFMTPAIYIGCVVVSVVELLFILWEIATV